MIKYLILLFVLIFTGCADLNSDEYSKETLNGEVISYNPPKRFYITYKLSNGDVNTDYISKRCSVKDNIIGTKVVVTKYTNKITKKVIYKLENYTKASFCN